MIISSNKNFLGIFLLLLFIQACKCYYPPKKEMYSFIIKQIIEHNDSIQKKSNSFSESYFKDAKKKLHLHTLPRKKAFDFFLNHLTNDKEQTFYWMEYGYGATSLCELYGTIWLKDSDFFYSYNNPPLDAFDENKLVIKAEGDSFGYDWKFMKSKVTEWQKDTILKLSHDTTWVMTHQDFVFAVRGEISKQTVKNIEIILFKEFSAPLDLEGL